MNALLRRNIELKTRCSDLVTAMSIARLLPHTDAGIQHQIDTYFYVPQGRLKLREIAGDRAELIWYNRSNEARSRQSDYRLTPVSHPDDLKASLDAALGTRGIVAKLRHILLWQNVRIHFDEVKDLGSFIEFEAVITEGEDETTGHQRLQHLCKLLKLQPADYLDNSYADLMGLK